MNRNNEEDSSLQPTEIKTEEELWFTDHVKVEGDLAMLNENPNENEELEDDLDALLDNVYRHMEKNEDGVKKKDDDMMSTSHAMAPMTKEQWEKQESVVRRVYDEETGRHSSLAMEGVSRKRSNRSLRLLRNENKRKLKRCEGCLSRECPKKFGDGVDKCDYLSVCNKCFLHLTPSTLKYCANSCRKRMKFSGAVCTTHDQIKIYGTICRLCVENTTIRSIDAESAVEDDVPQEDEVLVIIRENEIIQDRHNHYWQRI